MRHIVLSLIIIMGISIQGQQKTYVPDDDFEALLESYNMGDGIANNDSVTTANINAVDSLNIFNNIITDLTGIEDFINLKYDSKSFFDKSFISFGKEVLRFFLILKLTFKTLVIKVFKSSSSLSNRR